MNQVTLQALGLLTGILTSEKPDVTREMKDRAAKAIDKLLTLIEKDIQAQYEHYSNLVL